MRVVPGRPDGPKPWQHLEGEALDLELARPEIRQVTHYVAGVGSRWGDVLGQVTGGGISKAILDGYAFLARFYEPGDRIWLVGFSRGAYTARSLGGLIGMCGVPKRFQNGADIRHDERARRLVCQQAYAVYREGSGLGEPGRVKRLAAADMFLRDCAWPDHATKAARAPYFIGVWDTVRSLGIPLNRWEIELPWWQYLFHDAELNRYVRHAYQALSLDDSRIQFHPTLWNEPTLAQRDAAAGTWPSEQDFEQVWFPGVHADVGGGYAEAGLSDITLGWMIDRTLAPEHPLLFQVADPKAGLRPDPVGGVLHDSRSGWWKKLVYQSIPRSVVRGIQDVESRAIARRDDRPAGLDESWRARITAPDATYDTPHLRGHPGYDRLRPPPS